MNLELYRLPNSELKKMITKEENDEVNDKIAGQVCQLVMRLKRKELTARVITVHIYPYEYKDIHTGQTVRQLIETINKEKFWKKVVLAITMVNNLLYL